MLRLAKHQALLAASALALGLTSSEVSAQKVEGYVKDSQGQVVKNPFNLCWRTGYWTPALATLECDPDLVPKPPPPPPPPPAAPPPPPPPPPPAARPITATNTRPPPAIHVHSGNPLRSLRGSSAACIVGGVVWIDCA